MTPLSRSLSGEIPPARDRRRPPPSRLDGTLVGAAFSAVCSALGLLVSVGLTVLKFLADCRCAATALNTCDGEVTRWLPSLAGVFDCTAAFDSPYSQLLGLPLTAWAAGLYATTLLLAIAAAARGPSAPHLVAWLFVAAAANVATSCVLFAISSWILAAWCLFCFCLYFISVALLASAGLALHGLHVNPWPQLRRRPHLPANLLALLALVVAAHAVPYTGRCDSHEPGCFRPVPPAPNTRLQLGSDDPDVILVVLVDPTCSACAREFIDLQALVRDDPALAVRLLHYPREPEGCGLPQVRVPVPMISSINAGACDLAFAVECLAERGGPASDDGARALEYVFATQSMTPRSAHLAAVLDAFVLDREARAALDRCVHARQGAVPGRIAEHLRYGAGIDVRSTPTVLVVPVSAGEPRWRDAQLLPGRGDARLRRAIARARALPPPTP